MRKFLHHFSWVLIISGLLLLLDAGLTIAYQEPVSAVYNHFQQNALQDDLAELSGAPPTALEQRALASLPHPGARVAFAARALGRKAQPGDAIGEIKAQESGLDKGSAEGTDHDDLIKGPRHCPETPMPGAPGTVAIAGPRTTYGAPFHNLDKLRK